MKKITFYLMMLFSITAFSQVEIIENFDNAPDFGLPAGWTGTGFFESAPYFACGDTGKSALTGFSSDPSSLPGETILTSPNYSNVTNATDLTVSFSVNVFEEGPVFIFPITYYAPSANWGSVTLEYSVDGGSNWTSAITIDDSNFTYVDNTTCTTIPASNLGALTAGNDFQARFVVNVENVDPQNGSLYVVIDNVSITQLASSPPNCDVPLLSPTDGSDTTDLNDTITWQAATGLPTGYTLSIGTSSGATDVLNSASTAETSYSLAGLGLTYDTQYFVNIVAYNGIGSATGCIEQSFTTRTAPVTGATCTNPIEITTFPYVGMGDDTSNYENNINEGPCGNFSGAYMTGYDVFYEITPATDMSINIELAQVSEYGAAIHVMEGCPDTATNCVALKGDNYSTAPPYDLALENVVLFAGNTYFIVLSSGGTDSSFSYDLLLITQNSCINPEFTLSPVPTCATGDFTVDVDVTYMGDATTLTLSDNFGNSIGNVSATGIVNIGPYASGSDVNITLTNDQDNNCSFNDSTFFYCPPVNDDCVNSIVLDVNTDDSCTLVTSATNAGATESASNPINCEFTNNNDVWYSFVATDETIILEYLNITAAIGNGGTNQSSELLEGSCGSFTSIDCFNGNYVTLNNLTINNTYYIRNNSNFAGEYAQNYDICLRAAPTPPINDECADATVLTLSTDETCNNLIYGTTVGATPSAENTCNVGFSANYKDVWYQFTAPETGIYEFTFNTANTDVSSNYFIYSGSCGALIEESTNCYNTGSQVQSMNSGEVRYLNVRSGDNGPVIDFDLCVFQLPPAASNNDCSTPTVIIESTDANGNNMISGDFANSYPSSEACDVGGKTIWYSFTPTYTGEYTFNLIADVGFPYYSVFNTDDCSLTSNNYVPNSGCYDNGELITSLVGGNTYLISVYSFNNNQTESFDLLVYPDASLSIDSNEFEAFKYYPNPVVNTLTIEAENSITKVSIYNMVGQEVQRVSPNDLNATIDMNELNQGVYFVNVTINEAKQTFKVIKK
ncbi:T9SS type A sorting domain-containing protein [Winogradskyella pulchriflava]|uniref:T9SS type A sorting domain-containing protein n=1 Tax=Winogradskyella pulchriflava TaxID=1110688 RepID=A0ABV6QAY1_9FLAO